MVHIKYLSCMPLEQKKTKNVYLYKSSDHRGKDNFDTDSSKHGWVSKVEIM